jgi:hypothetical protein
VRISDFQFMDYLVSIVLSRSLTLFDPAPA